MLNTEDLVRLQEDFCYENGLPLFLPISGICWRCGRNIFEGKYGYTAEDALKRLITACPHCYRSFCD